MSDLDLRPRYGRKALDAFDSNYFPVHTCRDCSEKYCNQCGDGDGTTCPECGSTNYSDYDKVYSE